MFEASEMLYIYVETPLHAGSGSSVGVVDLPIQRERVTGYPLVQASGIKGKLRAEVSEKAGNGAEAKERVRVIFGPENTPGGDTGHAGALSPGDARLLLFPVRSLVGVFAWTTSVNVLARFWRDVKAARSTYDQGQEPEWLKELTWQVPNEPGKNEALVTTGSKVVPDTGTKNVVLEEFAFTPSQDEEVYKNISEIADWLAKYTFPQSEDYKYFRDKLKTSLVILPEDAFRDFTQFATEVITRTRIDQTTKTVAQRALWTEEHLPSDTLLYAPLHASRPRTDTKLFNGDGKPSAAKILGFVRDLGLDRIQLGGDETVGRGIVKLRFGGEQQ